MTRTLWDILPPSSDDRQSTRVRVPVACSAPTPNQPIHTTLPQTPIRERYLDMQRTMLGQYGIRVRKWRKGTSGVAWQITYTDGTIARLIESPRPRGPVSAAVFLHEIGHHAIGFNVYRPRCLEELKAWCYSLDQMETWNITITERVYKRVHESLAYAVAKARRRGLKSLPASLVPYAASDRRITCFVDPRTSDAKGPDCPSDGTDRV